MPKASNSFQELTQNEKDNLQVDLETGLRVLAFVKLRGVTWTALQDGTERVRDDAGNPADWPE